MDKSKGMSVRLQSILTQRLKAEGWTSILEFTRKSGVGEHFTQETTRRCFNACEDKNVAPPTLAVVMYFLNYKQNEIKDILEQYTNDKIFYKLIGDCHIQLSIQEEALNAAYSKLVKADPSVARSIVPMLEMAGKAAGVNITKELKILNTKTL